MVIVLFAGGVGHWASNALLPKFGLKAPREQPKAKRRTFRAFMGVWFAMLAFVAWAFSTGRAGIGGAVLIVCLVLPEFALIPLHIRRSPAPPSALVRRAGSGHTADSHH